VDDEIKPEFNYFPETEELQDFQEMKMSKSVEAKRLLVVHLQKIISMNSK
jgi:hypothetical protein